MKFVIKRAEETDLSNIVELNNIMCGTQAEDEDFFKNRINYICLYENNCVGFLSGYLYNSKKDECVINKNDLVFYLETLFVKEEFRKKGIGQKLMQVALNEMKQENIKVVKLDARTYEENKPRLKRFYENNGFTQVKDNDSTMIKEL